MEPFCDVGCNDVVDGGGAHAKAGSVTGVSIEVGVGVDAASLDVDSIEMGQN